LIWNIESSSLAEINVSIDKNRENEVIEILNSQNEQIKSLKQENLFIHNQISNMKIQLENRLDQVQSDYKQLKLRYDDVYKKVTIGEAK
jgi:hypothetical protein